MKKTIATLTATTLLLTGCGQADDTSSSSTPPSTPSSSREDAPPEGSSVATTTTSEESSEEPATSEAAPIPESEPYIVECLFGTPGPTLMSDGTTRNTEYCGNQPGAQEHRDAESAAGYDPTKNYEDPQLPAYLTRTPEESRQQAEGQGWWSNCMATNTAEYCRANDPYQQ